MPEREIHYLGHSAFEITSEQGTRLIIDPFITQNPTCPYKLEEIDNPDLILVSHGAFDHLGDTLALAQRSHCSVIADYGTARHLLRQGLPQEQIRRGVWGFSLSHSDFNIRVVESHHLSIVISGEEMLTGMPLGFIIETITPGAIYHPGDTSIFGDAKILGELYDIKVGMLTAATEMTPREAAMMAGWLGLEVAIPMHYRGDEAPRQFAEWLKKEAPNTKALKMTPGQRINL